MQKKLSEWQTKYHEDMSERWSELERGVSAMESHRKDIPAWQYKKAQRLDKQAEKMKYINAFNAGKKRDEALEALADWLPKPSDSRRRRKVHRTISTKYRIRILCLRRSCKKRSRSFLS